MANDPEIPTEDKERWNLDREAYLDSLKDYMKVERVIGARDGEEETEYFIKWKGLYYDSCTWETASLVSELAQTEIDRYLDRSSKLSTSNYNESRLSTRSDYKPFRTQPSYIKGGELREFQIHGVNFLGYHWCKGNNVILADEMGHRAGRPHAERSLAARMKLTTTAADAKCTSTSVVVSTLCCCPAAWPPHQSQPRYGYCSLVHLATSSTTEMTSTQGI